MRLRALFVSTVLAVGTAGFISPLQHAAAADPGPTTCKPDSSQPHDTCSITSFTQTSLKIHLHVKHANPYCANGQTSNCVYSYNVGPSTSGYGSPASGSMTCVGTNPETLSSGDTLAPNATGVDCNVTWTWAPASYPVLFTAPLVEIDGQGVLPPNPGHYFNLSREVPGPTAEFTTAPGNTSGKFTFTSMATSRVGGLYETWSASDGTYGVGHTWTHTFATPGTYQVTLSVSDDSPHDTNATHDVSFAGGGGSTTITLIETLQPASDPGLFDLRIDGKTAVAAAPDGRTSVVPVKVGRHIVSQRPTDAASLPHYAVTLVCTKNGRPDVNVDATAAHLKIANNDREVCTFYDLRTAALHCDVPRLKGMSLAKAKNALEAAHCKTGKVTKPKHKHHHLKVKKSSPGRYAVLDAGAKVALVLH
ncbi:MAG: PKD domain-containing protein [Frankiaceae bacterium]|nr:PKD domain-containing protein [Frankiaceae bacterium]